MASPGAPVVICLIGITGEGKSTTGNMLCQDPSAFKTSRGMRSMTSTCSFIDFELEGVIYRVIDTPGLQDTNIRAEELLDRLRKFADLSPHGVDAFLFVVKRGRFRPEYSEAFKAFEEACTTEVLKHTVLLFTCLEDESNADFMQSMQLEDIPSLRLCVEKVHGRVVGVENKLGGKNRQLEDRTLVLAVVEKMRAYNKVSYNNQCLQDASAWRKDIEMKAKALEMVSNQQTVLQLLQDLLHGRCQRSDIVAKLSNLSRSEAKFKAGDVVDAIAVMGQVKEVCERLTFEANQLPTRCGKETCIYLSRYCSRHRECNRRGYSCNGSNHASNCILYPRYTYDGQVAASAYCTSYQVHAQALKLLDASRALVAETGKEFILQQLEHIAPAVAFDKLAKHILKQHKDIQESCGILAATCPERLTFHHEYSRTERETCGNSFRTEATRIQAANDRIAKFAEQLQNLAQCAKDKAACVLQASVRGWAARKLFAGSRRSDAMMSSRITASGYPEEAHVQAGEASEQDAQGAPLTCEGEAPTPSQQPRKRPTRRGGMNKRHQDANQFDSISIPATDDGFD